jgi:hypothetical protein
VTKAEFLKALEFKLFEARRDAHVNESFDQGSDVLQFSMGAFCAARVSALEDALRLACKLDES